MDIKNAYALAERIFAGHEETPIFDGQDMHGTIARLTHLLLTEPHEDGAAALVIMGYVRKQQGLDIAKKLFGYIRTFADCDRIRAAAVLDRFRLAVQGPRIETIPDLQAKSRAFLQTAEIMRADLAKNREIANAIRARFN